MALLHSFMALLNAHNGFEHVGSATLVWPAVPNPSLPADNEIVGSTFQLVLVPDLCTLNAPIVLCQVLHFFPCFPVTIGNGRYSDQNKWSMEAWKPVPMRGASLLVTPSFFNLKTLHKDGNAWQCW